MPETPPLPNPKPITFTPEELAKAKAAKAKAQELKVEPEYFIMAEFGYYFGYDGIRAIVNNELELAQVNQLSMASRKIWRRQQADIAEAMFIAAASAKAKKPSTAFKKAVSFIRKAAKI